MPIVGSLETPNKLPGSITEDVLGEEGGESETVSGGVPVGATAAAEDR